jgi:hypothetical protein
MYELRVRAAAYGRDVQAMNAVVCTLPQRQITVFKAYTVVREQPRNEADCIPDWAAIAVLIGFIVALGGFIWAWIDNGGWSTATLTVGLIIAAIGMRAAERVVNQKAEWRPI